MCITIKKNPAFHRIRKTLINWEGLLISFWDMSVSPEFKKSLEVSQSEMLAHLKWTGKKIVNSSEIVKVNNIRFLVCEYQKREKVYLWFKSDYNDANEFINGIIQFEEPDKDKAHKALDELLQTMHLINSN